MRSGFLLDTGPLVALLYRTDRYHEWAVETFANLDPPAITCEPVLTEACFIVVRNRHSAVRVLEHIAHSGIQIGLQIEPELPAIEMLMRRYANVPMSLADACLVRLGEINGLPICTLDSDFALYRANGRRPLSLITPPARSLHEP